jgi:tetratricopeptide (TPR) repeat protein
MISRLQMNILGHVGSDGESVKPAQVAELVARACAPEEYEGRNILLRDKAIELYQLNVTYFPNSPRVYESLGRAYIAKGETASAIKNYEKSLELNPANKNLADRLQRLKEGK